MNANNCAITFKKVSKKYLVGEKYYPSLRDWITTMFSKDFFIRKKSFFALKNLSFCIKKGKSVGIIGPNGAGKSTILKLISRVISPTTGIVATQGRIAGLLELGAGFHPELTGRENIFFQGAILGMSKGEINKRMGDIISFAELGEFIDSPIKHFSSGMYARLGFSVAVHIEPEILLIDEVLAVGDLSFHQKCMKFMKGYCRNKQRTVIFVTHSLENIKEICDEVIWLEKGEIKERGETEVVTSLYRKRYQISDKEKNKYTAFV